LIDASWSHVDRLLKFVETQPFWTNGMGSDGMPAQQGEGRPAGQMILPLELKTWRYLPRVIPIVLLMVAVTVILWTIGKPNSSTRIWRIVAPLLVVWSIVQGLKRWYRVRVDEAGLSTWYPFRSKTITWNDITSVNWIHEVDRMRVGSQRMGLFRQTLAVFRLSGKPLILEPGELLESVYEALRQELGRRQAGDLRKP
jgi:hypothetical protein